MPSKSDKSEQPAELSAVEQRVEAMMNPEQSTPSPKAAASKKPEAASVPATKTPQTAPELPGDLMKEAKSDETKVKVTVGPSTAKPEPEAVPEEPAASEPLPSADIENSVTDEAVEDIVAKEGDTLLALDDAKAARKQKAKRASAGSWKDKLRRLLKDKRTWAAVAVVLVIVFALPMTRYKVLGLVLKKPVTITVIDSKTNTPVSNAEVKLGGDSVKTDANGKAKLKAAVGDRDLVIDKQYYQQLKSSYFVGLSSSPPAEIKLTATGRLVPVTVLNKVTGKPLAGVQVRILSTTAKTDKKGLATIALPTKSSTEDGKLSLNSFNAATVKVQVTDKAVKANTFELTPAGYIYFLSNRTGKLDVVRTKLDGTDRKVVLEGTGKEDKNTTSLLASRDWRYLVLKSRRDGDLAALYLIDTATDKVTQFDNGSAQFDLVGWYDHSFIYSLTRTNVYQWEPNRQALKSYDAERQQLNLLDQSQADGNAASHAYQTFLNFYILKGAIVYNSHWNTYIEGYGSYDLSGKNSTIRSVQPGGQNKKDHQSFPAKVTGYISASLYEPEEVYYAVYYNDTNKTLYYEYENGAVKAANVSADDFNQAYPTFLLSPSGSQTFWTELRDGKNSLFTGNDNAENKKEVASLSDYTPYGWHSDNYVLLAKNSSELYIMAPGGQAKGRAPLKITDYYKPAQTYPGYGYGYGGQ